MSYNMPVSNYKWLTKEEIEKIDFLNVDLTNDWGFIAEVDLSVSTYITIFI